MLDADEAKLTRTGTITIREGEIYVDGFHGSGTSCRDVVALACVWAIGKLQEELLATLQAPGGGIAGIGSPEPLDVQQLKGRIEHLEAYCDDLKDWLHQTAVALRGAVPPVEIWRWSDLPKHAAAAAGRAERLRADATAAVELLRRYRERNASTDLLSAIRGLERSLISDAAAADRIAER